MKILKALLVILVGITTISCSKEDLPVKDTNPDKGGEKVIYEEPAYSMDTRPESKQYLGEYVRHTNDSLIFIRRAVEVDTVKVKLKYNQPVLMFYSDEVDRHHIQPGELYEIAFKLANKDKINPNIYAEPVKYVFGVGKEGTTTEWY